MHTPYPTSGGKGSVLNPAKQESPEPTNEIASLAVIVRYRIIGGLPFSSLFVNIPEHKEDIQQRLRYPNFLRESKLLGRSAKHQASP
jgi:hypothetical protein